MTSPAASDPSAILVPSTALFAILPVVTAPFSILTEVTESLAGTLKVVPVPI